MSDTTAVGAKAKGNKAAKKTNAEGKSNMDAQIGRMMVRAVWSQEWAAANPDATGEDRKAAWKDARSGAMEKSLKTYRRAIALLKRTGVTITLSDEAAAGADGNDDSVE